MIASGRYYGPLDEDEELDSELAEDTDVVLDVLIECELLELEALEVLVDVLVLRLLLDRLLVEVLLLLLTDAELVEELDELDSSSSCRPRT